MDSLLNLFTSLHRLWHQIIATASSLILSPAFTFQKEHQIVSFPYLKSFNGSSLAEVG